MKVKRGLELLFLVIFIIASEAFLQLLHAFKGCALIYFSYFNETSKPDELDHLETSRIAVSIDSAVRDPESATIFIQTLSVNEVNLTTRHPLSAFQRRFARCYVHVVRSRFVRTFAWTRNNNEPQPQFTVIDRSSLDYESYARSDLIFMAVPTVYLESVDYQQVFFICFHCHRLRGKGLVPLRRSDIHSLDTLRRGWSDLHRNLEQSFIATENHREHVLHTEIFKDEEGYYCRPYSSRRGQISLHHQACTFVFLGEKFNISWVRDYKYNKSPFYELSKIFYSAAVTPLNREIIRNQWKVWIPHAANIEPYAFVVIYDEDLVGTKVEGILKPFSIIIWIIMGISSFGTAAVISFNRLQLLKTKRELFASQMKTCFLLSGLLIDQGAGASSIFAGLKMVAMTTWFWWSMFSLILSHSYRAFLFSSLSTAPAPQNVPENLEELMGSGIRLATTYSYTSGNSTIPAFMEGILKTLVEVHGTSNIFRKLSESLSWFSDNTDRFTYLAVKYSLAFKDRNEIIRLPKVFAILDPESNVDMVKTVFEMYSRKWITKPSILPLFVSRDFWTIYGNFLYPLLSRSVAQVCESGIHGRLAVRVQTLSKMLMVNDIFHRIFKNATKADFLKGIEDGGPRIPMKDMRKYLDHLEDRENKWDVREMFAQVPRKVFLDILWHFGGCVAITMSVFVVERMWHIKRKR